MAVCTKPSERSAERHSALLRAFSEAAYYSISTDASSSSTDSASAGTVDLSKFVSMSERELMAVYKEAVSSGTDTAAMVADVKLFLDAQIVLAADHVALLQSVLQATSSQHLAAYVLTMRGIKAEPQFGVFVARAAAAAQTAQDRHGPRVSQTTTDLDALYVKRQPKTPHPISPSILCIAPLSHYSADVHMYALKTCVASSSIIFFSLTLFFFGGSGTTMRLQSATRS